MKKTPLLISLVVVSAFAGGSFAYGWYSVTNIPTQSSEIEPAPTSEPPPVIGLEPEQPSELPSRSSVSSELPVQQQLANLAHTSGEMSLTFDEPQLNQLINDAIQNQPQAAQIFANAQSVQTTLKGELIETGTVLNLSELPREDLPADMRMGLDQLMAVAPMFSDRDIYVGLVARPQVQAGKLSLDQDLRFRVGQFTLPLADVAEQMGISTSDIEHRLNTILEQQGLTLEAIDIVDGKLVITGTK